MSLKDEIENISKEIEANQGRIQNLQSELLQMQDTYTKVVQEADEIVKSTTELAKKLEIPCNETISLGESLKKLQDDFRGKLKVEDEKWEDMEKDVEESNSCLRNYLDHYQTTVLNLADQTSIELDPDDSVTSASPKTSLESSSSHFQQMLVAPDPLADRELFRNLDTKDLSVTEDIETMKEQLEKFKETHSIIATEVERISRAVKDVYENNFSDKTETSNDGNFSDETEDTNPNDEILEKSDEELQ